MRSIVALPALLLLVAFAPPVSAQEVCEERHVQVGPVMVLDGNVCNAWRTYVCLVGDAAVWAGVGWTCIPLGFCTFCPGPVLA